MQRDTTGDALGECTEALLGMQWVLLGISLGAPGNAERPGGLGGPRKAQEGPGAARRPRRAQEAQEGPGAAQERPSIKNN